jgi:flavin-dependent dehydrogenase
MTYDTAIVGGGLAGLTLSIQLVKAGYRVVLFEKEQYPFHRVCGEYISHESTPHLQQLGFDPLQQGLPQINRLIVTDPKGKPVEAPLRPGGFAISRYRLDHQLAQLARENGVELLEQTKVNAIDFDGGHFSIHSTAGTFEAVVCVGAFGKRSNLDIKWERPFTTRKTNKLNGFIAVKYHVGYSVPPGSISLHNFENGYCGISEIEDGRCCLCYLTTADNLRRSNHSIREMEKNILCKNPALSEIFSGASFLLKDPLTISQVSFDKKSTVHEHILLAGDSAGLIAPLCGNGMSMAMHASKLAVEPISLFLDGKIDREVMENWYSRAWEQEFANRLKTGRFIQSIFGRPALTGLFLDLVRPFPSTVQWLIGKTHGPPF